MKRNHRAQTQSHQNPKFLALARVSSREQEREGFSLDVQETALKAYAARAGGSIVKLYRIAETASKHQERKTFQEMLAYARSHTHELHGLLFYKIDRASRNLVDYVELEKLESDHGVRLIAVSQPTENTPAGRMQRRMLASMASFYTEQQSLDVKEGLRKRAESGLFVGGVPYGYRNVRVDGRSNVVVDEREANNVRLIFELYAWKNHTIDSLVSHLNDNAIIYTSAQPRWQRSIVHRMLHDRSYIGELSYKGLWLPGTHTPIINRLVWDRVRALLGGATYKSHELTFAGGLIRCGCCGNLITGEAVTKKTTGKQYIYYRCTMNNLIPDHHKVRLPEAKLDQQVVAILRRMRQPDTVRDWFAQSVRMRDQRRQQASIQQVEALQQQLTQLRQQQDRLLNLRLNDEIETGTFAQKNTELRDRIAAVTLQLEAADRQRDEHSELAIKVFELSQELPEKWLNADYSAKRRIMEILFLNLKLEGATLVPTMTKPFDALVEGPFVSSSRGNRI